VDPVVAHVERPHTLLGDVHELERDVVARDELAQPGEDVGVEDVVVGGRLTLLEHAQEVAYVGVGHDPVPSHRDTSVSAVRPG
jgi:hypothetical protein